MLHCHSLCSYNHYNSVTNKRTKIILFGAYSVSSENEPKFGFIQLWCAWTPVPKENVAALNTSYLLSKGMFKNSVLFLMIHLSLQTREQAVRLLWFAATGCPFPPLLPWKHMLDEAEPGIDLKYMISKLFAFPCKESFTSCFYKTLCEEENPLGRGSFWGVWLVLMQRFESIIPEHVNVLLRGEVHDTGQRQWLLELVSLWLWHLGSEEFGFYVNSLLYFRLLPGEVKIVPSSAFQDPKDTKFVYVIAPCVLWAAPLLPGSW